MPFNILHICPRMADCRHLICIFVELGSDIIGLTAEPDRADRRTDYPNNGLKKAIHIRG